MIRTFMLMAQLSRFEIWRSRINLSAPIGETCSLCSPFRLSRRTIRHIDNQKGQILTNYMLLLRFLGIQLESSLAKSLKKTLKEEVFTFSNSVSLLPATTFLKILLNPPFIFFNNAIIEYNANS